MTYDAEKLELGREPITFVEIDLGFCSLTYSNSPCTAAVGVTGTQKCFNARETCQDPDNYTDSTKTYRYCQPRDNLPIGIELIPSIVGDITRAPTSTTAGKGLGNRAVVTIQLNDHTWDDVDVDPYFSERTYNPEETGTYWGKFLARNPYYEGRELRVRQGYLTTPFDWANFQTEVYDIAEITGPVNSKVTIKAKDVLARTYSNKAQYPAASTGELVAGITAGATSATLTPTGIGNDEYPASGTLSIGSEAMTFTRSGDVLTLTRAQWGTEAQAHNAGDTVQVCAAWDDINVLNVLEELLETGAGLPSSYIPYDDTPGSTNDWDLEKSVWLTTALVNGILMKPEPIDKVIAELSETFLFDIWWDTVDQTVQVKSLSPERSGETIDTLTDEYNLLRDSVSVKRDTEQRVSEVRVYYNKVNHSDSNDREHFAGLYIHTDISSEGSTRYGRKAIKTIITRWTNSKASAQLLGGRTSARFVDTPTIISFSLDKKDEDSISMAGRVEIDTKYIQSFTGENEPSKFQITEIKEAKNGSSIQVMGLSSSFSGRYFFIAPDGTLDYSAASEDEKQKYGFICYDVGTFLDGTEAYKVI